MHMLTGPTEPGPVPPEAADLESSNAYRRRWWTLAVLCLSVLIVFIGNSSLNVTLPTLARDLHATSSQLQWVVALYSLVFAGLLFSTGALGDRYGRKGALQFGFVLFLAGAGLASASHAMWELIACRAIMGAAAAFIMPSTLSILINVFPPGERAKAIAIWASIIGAAGALGPLTSGVLLGHFWWGSVFLINIPIVIVALIGGWFLVPKSRDPEQERLDPLGAALSIVGIVALVYGLIQAPEKGWLSPPTLAAFAVALIGLALFVAWELRAKDPMLDMHFFKNPAFSTGTGGMVLVFMAMYGVIFLLTLYFQLVLGYTPLSAAVRMLPIAAIMLTVSPTTPRLTARFGAHRTVGGGLILMSLGMLAMRGIGVHASYAYVVVSLLPVVAGIALSMSPMTASIMSAVPTRRAGAGSAMNDATRELGAALGVAVLGSLAISRYANHLRPLLAGFPPAARIAASSSLAGAQQAAAGLPHARAVQFLGAANLAFVDGFHLAVTVGAVLAIVSAAIVLRYLPPHLPVDTGVGASWEAPGTEDQPRGRATPGFIDEFGDEFFDDDYEDEFPDAEPAGQSSP